MSLRTDRAIHSIVNAAKKEIKELKKGSGSKLIKSAIPTRLWGDCLEFESCIRSNTAHGIKTKSGETSNISQFCEFEWFEWVMF